MNERLLAVFVLLLSGCGAAGPTTSQAARGWSSDAALSSSERPLRKAAPAPIPAAAKAKELPPRTSAPWIAPELGITGSGDVEAALDRPFTYTIAVGNEATPPAQATVTNCRDYFRLHEAGFGALSNDDHDSLRLEGVRCIALTKVAKMVAGEGDPKRALLGGKQVLAQLPATVGPSVSDHELEGRKKSEQAGQSWATYDKRLKLENKGGVLAIRERDSTSELTPLASGDLNGDGRQELLVRAMGYGNEGSWADIALLVLALDEAAGKPRFRLIERVQP